MSKHIVRVPSTGSLEQLLEKHVSSSLVEPPAKARIEVSLDRRRSDAGDTLLVVNESWASHSARLRFVHGGGRLTLWNPMSGTHEVLRENVKAGETIALDLEAAESLLLTLAIRPHAAP